MAPSTLPVLQIPKSAARALRQGHPWVWREPSGQPPGTLLVLQQGREVVGWGLADDGPITVRVLGLGAPGDLDFGQVVAERLRRADAFRFRAVGGDTNCWRVVNAAGDGLPGLVVDRYADVAVLKVYSAAWEPHLEAVVRALVATGWVNTVLRRFGVRRVDGAEGGVVLHGPPVPDRLVVLEHGMRLLVRPLVGQKTGLFLDQREHRRLVGSWASGRRVANLFAYTGGFSVAAALGGAARVTTVDVAEDAIEDARENFRLNDLDPDAHGFEVADVFSWNSRGTVDLLVVDPPSLARGREADAAAARAYERLHLRLGPRVSRDGLLATSSCTARLTMGAWQSAVQRGLEGPWSWLWVSGAPVDHPVAMGHDEGHYLKFALLRKR